MLMIRVTPKISDSPAPTKNRLDAAASPLSAWNATASRVIGAKRASSPSPQSKSAVADFDPFVEWPKPAYTRIRLGEGRGGGSGGCGPVVPHSPTPTPDPSPQG